MWQEAGDLGDVNGDVIRLVTGEAIGRNGNGVDTGFKQWSLEEAVSVGDQVNFEAVGIVLDDDGCSADHSTGWIFDGASDGSLRG